MLYDNSADSNFISQSSGWTFSYTVGTAANRLLLAAFFTSPSSNHVTAVTYGGVSMTHLATVTDQDGNSEFYFYLKNPPSGANNFVTTMNSTFSVELQAVSYSGVDQTATPFPHNSVTNTGSNTSPLSFNIVTSVAGVWLVTMFRGSPLTVEWTTSNMMVNRIRAGVGMSTWDTNGPIGGAATQSVTYANGADPRVWGPIAIAIVPIPPPAVSVAGFFAKMIAG